MVARVGAIPGADKLNWKTSIVDLMKLLQLDPSYENRKELAGEVGIAGYSGSAEDNIALHKAVMKKLADAGGTFLMISRTDRLTWECPLVTGGA